MVNDPFRRSHPIRRGIVERLALGPKTVGEGQAALSFEANISKHPVLRRPAS